MQVVLPRVIADSGEKNIYSIVLRKYFTVDMQTFFENFTAVKFQWAASRKEVDRNLNVRRASEMHDWTFKINIASVNI